MKVIKDWSTVIKMGKLVKMEIFSRLFPGPGGRVWLEIGQGLQVHIGIFECHQI